MKIGAHLPFFDIEVLDFIFFKFSFNEWHRNALFHRKVDAKNMQIHFHLMNILLPASNSPISVSAFNEQSTPFIIHNSSFIIAQWVPIKDPLTYAIKMAMSSISERFFEIYFRTLVPCARKRLLPRLLTGKQALPGRVNLELF